MSNFIHTCQFTGEKQNRRNLFDLLNHRRRDDFLFEMSEFEDLYHPEIIVDTDCLIFQFHSPKLQTSWIKKQATQYGLDFYYEMIEETIHWNAQYKVVTFNHQTGEMKKAELKNSHFKKVIITENKEQPHLSTYQWKDQTFFGTEVPETLCKEMIKDLL